jgi:hypothetical protein
MKLQCEIKVHPSLTKKTTVNDGNLFRDLALKIVNTMPFDELSKLIQFKKIDPFSSESQLIIQQNKEGFEIQEILNLRDEN